MYAEYKIAFRFISGILMLLIAGSGFQGCNGSRGQRAENESNDLAGRFVLVHPGSARHLQRLEVNRKGSRRKSLVLVAPSIIRGSLEGISGRRHLELSAAPVFNVGDGVQMNVFLRSAGKRIPLVNRYFDAGRKAEDRDWVRVEIPLDVRRGDQIEIEAAAGPLGDLAADWLAISSIRIMP